MYNVKSAGIINLRSLGTQVEICYVTEDCILFLARGKEGVVTNYKFRISSGSILKGWPEFRLNVLGGKTLFSCDNWTRRFDSYLEPEVGRLQRSWKENQLGDRIFELEMQPTFKVSDGGYNHQVIIEYVGREATQAESQFVRALLSQDVEPDKILKGLNAMGIVTTGIKIVHNYLGGYQLSIKDRVVPLETFLEAMETSK